MNGMEEIRVGIIRVGERHRALSEPDVERLMQSMAELGLRQPLTIRVADTMVIDGRQVEGVPVLIAGHHRLEAAKRLGWSHIDCIEVDDDQLRAELWEIDENLIRAELTPAQQADHLSRRKEIWEALRNSGPSCPSNERGRPKEFAQDTAARTGEAKRTINRQVARADALGPDIKLVAGTSLDKGVELDALAKMSADQRAPIIAAAQRGEQVSARPVLADQEVIIKQADAIIAAWNRACPEARSIAMDQMDGPVFDRTRAAG